MGKPHKLCSTTVFVTEGTKAALVVTADGWRMTKRRMQFDSPEAALAWCRLHRAAMVYAPVVDPSRN
jgi:hypothetical protein